jgi:hypothetical protein
MLLGYPVVKRPLALWIALSTKTCDNKHVYIIPVYKRADATMNCRRVEHERTNEFWLNCVEVGSFQPQELLLPCFESVSNPSSMTSVPLRTKKLAMANCRRVEHELTNEFWLEVGSFQPQELLLPCFENVSNPSSMTSFPLRTKKLAMASISAYRIFWEIPYLLVIILIRILS